MKILLVCANGMSTSIIVEKMKKALNADEQHFEILARPIDQFEEIFSDYDVVLLGPQVKYKRNEFSALAETKGIPVGVINPADYGLGNGENILKYAKELVNNK